MEALAVTKNRVASGAHSELYIWRWNYNGTSIVQSQNILPHVSVWHLYWSAVMSYQERALTTPSRLGSDEDVVVTALHWLGRGGGGSPTLLVVGYMHHGIRYAPLQ